MDIILSNASGKPIYEQITDQIKEQIMAGALSAGDALPSMRLLAKELRISVITTKRAYEELERDGFLENEEVVSIRNTTSISIAVHSAAITNANFFLNAFISASV